MYFSSFLDGLNTEELTQLPSITQLLVTKPIMEPPPSRSPFLRSWHCLHRAKGLLLPRGGKTQRSRWCTILPCCQSGWFWPFMYPTNLCCVPTVCQALTKVLCLKLNYMWHLGLVGLFSWSLEKDQLCSPLKMYPWVVWKEGTGALTVPGLFSTSISHCSLQKIDGVELNLHWLCFTFWEILLKSKALLWASTKS